jgi:hypothetical protein
MNESTSDIRNHIHGFDIGSISETIYMVLISEVLFFLKKVCVRCYPPCG